MPTVLIESAYQFQMLAERAARFRVQSELFSVCAERAEREAREILTRAGFDPRTDTPVTDDGAVCNGVPVPKGTMLRAGQLFAEPTQETPVAHTE